VRRLLSVVIVKTKQRRTLSVLFPTIIFTADFGACTMRSVNHHWINSNDLRSEMSYTNATYTLATVR